MQTKRLGGVVFAFLLLSLVIVPLASAAVFDPIKSMFTDWEAGNLSFNIAKYVFWIIISLVIFSILGFMTFFKENEAVQFIVAFLVGFLATAYFTPSDVYTLLASYSALGFVLGVALPIIILVYFSIQIRKTGGAAGLIFSHLLWVLFIAFTAYKIYEGNKGNLITDAMTIGYYIAMGLAVVWILFSRRILRALFKIEITAEADAMASGSRSALLAEAARLDKQAEAVLATPGGSKRDAEALRKRAHELREAASKGA